MEPYKRDFFIARIRAGYIPVELEGHRFCIYHPDSNVELLSQEKYMKVYEQATEEGLMTKDECYNFLIKQNIWSSKLEEEYSTIVPGHIDYWKIELYQSILKSKTKERVRKYLQAAKDEYERLSNIRHFYDYVTVSGYANYVRSLYILSQCTKLNEEPVDWSQYNLNSIMNKYYSSMLSSKDIRELSRTSPWAGLWGILKNTGNIFENRSLTMEQQSLLSWSLMYDKIYESPDCPSDDIIEDDDVLDGWLLLQKRKREAEKNQQEVESKINPKMQDADEIFIPAETQQDAQKIEDLNPQQVRNIKRQRAQQLQGKKRIQEQEFKDVQQKRSMQMQQAFNQQAKGRQ